MKKKEKTKSYVKEGPYGKIKTARGLSSNKKLWRVYKMPVMKMFGGWLANTHAVLDAKQIRAVLDKYGDRPGFTITIYGWSFDEPKKRS